MQWPPLENGNWTKTIGQLTHKSDKTEPIEKNINHNHCIKELSIPEVLFKVGALASQFTLADIFPTPGKLWQKDIICFLKSNLEKRSWIFILLGSFNGCSSVRIFNKHDRSSLFATKMIKLGLAQATDSSMLTPLHKVYHPYLHFDF